MIEHSKTWTPQAQENRTPLTSEQLDKYSDGALLAASMFMAKTCPGRFPNCNDGAETLRTDFALWTTAMEVLNHFGGWTPPEEALVGSDINAEDEISDIDSDLDVADEATLETKIEDAVGAAADYHDAPHDASGAASSSTEPAVGVGAVPGFRAAQTPPLPGAVPGSRATPTTPAPDAVPGSRAVSDAVVPVAPPSRSTAVQTMRETLSLIGNEKIKLPGIVDQVAKFNKEIRTAFNFGPKFPIGKSVSQWNQFQHSVVQILPDQSGAAKRNTREGVFIPAGKHAAQVFHDVAVAGPISEMLTDVSAVTMLPCSRLEPNRELQQPQRQGFRSTSHNASLCCLASCAWCRK